jgi:hypothetical protein
MIRGMFDELHFDIDTDFLQLLLHQRHDLGEGEGFTDEIVLDGETIGVSSLCQKLLACSGSYSGMTTGICPK